MCRLGDLLCFMYVYLYLSLLLSMHVCFVLFPLFDLSFVDFPSVLRYCWLSLLNCKNCLPYNLYCVGGDVKPCTIQSKHTVSLFIWSVLFFLYRSTLCFVYTAMCCVMTNLFNLQPFVQGSNPSILRGKGRGGCDLMIMIIIMGEYVGLDDHYMFRPLLL